MRCGLNFRVFVACFLVFFSTITSAVSFNDGGLHVISYPISGSAVVDWEAPGVGTRLEIVSGGQIERRLEMYEDGQATVDGGTVGTNYEEYGDGASTRDNARLSIISGSVMAVWANDNSMVQVKGGTIPYGLGAWDYSDISISGGNLADVQGYGESTIEISGGSIETWTLVGDNSVMTVSGGQYAYGFLAGRHDAGDYGITENGVIRFAGTGFSVNGHAVGYGESALPYAVPVTIWGSPGLLATVTGTLASGQAVSEYCYIFGDSDVLFVPEPATLFLLGLGLAQVARRRE